MELFAGQYWGSDAAGLREVSRAHALADEARSLLKQRISSDLMLQTQRLAARGGLPKAPPGALGAFDAKPAMQHYRRPQAPFRAVMAIYGNCQFWRSLQRALAAVSAEEPALVTAVPVAHEHMRAVASSPARLRPAPVVEDTHSLDVRPRQ